MFIPYSTEVLIKRWPATNLAIIGLCVVALAVTLIAAGPTLDEGETLGPLEMFVLRGWHPVQLAGDMFLHASLWHLFFNMLYLWVFGNAVCEKTGNLVYACVFLVCGALSGTAHLLFDGGPAVGASGAINGVIGFYLVLYPVNRVNCFYFFFIKAGTFAVAGFWLILLWFGVDAWCAISGAGGNTAYWAHVGGILVGFLLGLLFLGCGWVKMRDYDNPTLLDCLRPKR